MYPVNCHAAIASTGDCTVWCLFQNQIFYYARRQNVLKAEIAFTWQVAGVGCSRLVLKLDQNLVSCTLAVTLTLNPGVIWYKSRTWDMSCWFWDNFGETGMDWLHWDSTLLGSGHQTFFYALSGLNCHSYVLCILTVWKRAKQESCWWMLGLIINMQEATWQGHFATDLPITLCNILG